jgi:hypothetical protein
MLVFQLVLLDQRLLAGMQTLVVAGVALVVFQFQVEMAALGLLLFVILLTVRRQQVQLETPKFFTIMVTKFMSGLRLDQSLFKEQK